MTEHQNAFSLSDETGKCPQGKVHLKLHYEAPFIVHPYAITKE